MRIGVLGTGTVGQAIATRMVELGHQVTMGARDAGNPAAAEWAAGAGDGAEAGDFAAAAAAAELVVNATAGAHSLAALGRAGAENLAGKVLLDVANALDHSAGFPPVLAVGQDDSLAERIQRAHPRARVVKALNTMNGDVMMHPELVPGEHEVFMAGDDDEAKAAVAALLAEVGWPAGSIVDTGGLVAARGLEVGVLFWVALRVAIGHNRFNFHVAGR